MTWHNSSDEKGAIGTDGFQRGKISPTCSKSFSLLPALRGWYWRSVLRVLVIELRNLGHRIRWALEIRSWEHRGFQGQHPFELKATAYSQCQICRPVYIADTRQILNLQPSLTVVDACLVSQAWLGGGRSANPIDQKQNERKNS